MDWGFVGALFGILVIAGVLIHVLVRGEPILAPVPTPAPAPSEVVVAAVTDTVTQGPTTTSPTTSNPLDLEAVRVYKPESWCFVHEDHLGRWCVKTPTPTSCEPYRRFQSREACELVSANTLPLSLVGNRGATRRPVAAMSNGLF